MISTILKLGVVTYLHCSINGFSSKSWGLRKQCSLSHLCMNSDSNGAPTVNQARVLSVLSAIGLFYQQPNLVHAETSSPSAAVKSELKSALNEYKAAISKETPKTPVTVPSTTTTSESPKPKAAPTPTPQTKSKAPEVSAPAPPAAPAPYKIQTDEALLKQLSGVRKGSSSSTDNKKGNVAVPVSPSKPAVVAVKPSVPVPKPAVVAPVPKPVVKTSPVVTKSAVSAPVAPKLLPEEIAFNTAVSKKSNDISKQTEISNSLRNTKQLESQLKNKVTQLEKDISSAKSKLVRQDIDKVQGQKDIDEIIRLQKLLAQNKKDLATAEAKAKKETSDLESLKTAITNDEAAIKQKDADVKRKKAEIAKQEALARAQAKAKAIAKAKADIAAAESQVLKSSKDAKAVEEKVQSAKKFVDEELAKERKAEDEVKQKLAELERAKSAVTSTVNEVKAANEKLAATKTQLESANKKVKADQGVVEAAKKSLSAANSLK